MAKEPKTPIYTKDKNDLIVIRTSKQKKAAFKSIVGDMSESVNGHMDEVIKKHGTKQR